MSDVIEKPAQPRMTVDDMIDKYLRLREKTKKIKEEHTKQLAPYANALNTLEAWLLEALNEAKLKSMSSPHGTAYKTTRTSAKVTDWPAVLTFIRQNEAWDLLEARVSKLAAETIIEETQHPIPGVETSSEVCCNVRRAGASSEGK